jgi:hypothetical protein
MSETEERIVEVTLDPSSPRTQTDMIRVPFGEVHRITEVECLDQPSPDFELALHVNGVRQTAVYALTAYAGNRSKPMIHAFANCPLQRLDLAYFVATPVLPITKPLSARFRLKIAKSAA